ncbi:sugar-binding domain-containing protein [Maribellus sediminis]|uniref:sugar-binding domain-containing protein n=1 Tax=Maribellus sediminis TaxID=2696285 RepID=UPI0014318888|nr:sugar-binding domain-containing protein [Maribellus sediminis]
MRRTRTLGLISILICLLMVSCKSTDSYRKITDLSGEWSFKLDSTDIGKQEKWFSQTLEEKVKLPGTTDENKKGYSNKWEDVGKLSRKYYYEGKAWYQRTVEIPTDWQGKTIQLFLERTKATEVWIDDKPFPLQKNLQSPHVYDLTEALTPGKHRLTICVDNSKELFPVGGSHALAEHTQTNWNGIIGKLELQAIDKVNIKSAKLYPDIHTKTVKIVFQIENPASEQLTGKIRCVATGFNGNSHNVKPQTFEFSSDKSEIEVTGLYAMGDFAKWDEFTPNLYKLSAVMSATSQTNTYKDKIEDSFGMVEFKAQGTQFAVNGKVTFLRGKHDGCVFPLTGYPPMTKEGWIRHMQISKEYGINHFRFHSWTPPKAAFEAADIVGIYMQAELPCWRSFNEDDQNHYNFQKQEGELMFDAFGNHPSFVMFSLGNELGGSREEMAKMVAEFKQYDSRILFAQGSNNYFWDPQVQPGEDFFVSMRTQTRAKNSDFDIRASFSFADSPDGGIINGQFPNTEQNYSKALHYCNVPAVGHETGQFQSLPNFEEISKYTGILEARNFEVFKQRMIDKNMFPYWKELFMASGKLAAMCYKADNEIALRTPGFGGFQILDLQDFPGQGTALVGMLDAFMDSKGFITPEEWRQSCAAQTIQAKMPKYVWESSEEFRAELITINYGEGDLTDESIKWTLSDENGAVLSQGETEKGLCKQGEITNSGIIRVLLSSIRQAKRLTLSLTSQSGLSNQYNIWVYPAIEQITKPEDIIVASTLDKTVLKDLEQGKKVLLFPDSASVAGNSTGGLFTSDYWCYPMFRGICENLNKPVSPGTLGLLIDTEHPVFAAFPTSKYTDWQWWSVIKKSRPIMIDSADASYRPIIQVVDNFERCSRLGLMFEFAVGEGKLFVCSCDLSDGNDVVAQTLKKSILDYMESDKFNPKENISKEGILKVIYGTSGVKL